MVQDIEKTEGSALDMQSESDEYIELPKEDEATIDAISTAIKKPISNMIAKFLIAGLIISAVIIFVSGFIKYSELQNEKQRLQEQIDQKQENIEETEYLLDIPVNDKDYIIRIAKEKLGLFLPNEIVYYSDLNE